MLGEVFKDLSLLEHYVLGAMARLHEQSRGPKCFFTIVEQVSKLYGNPHMRHQEPSVDVSTGDQARQASSSCLPMP